MLSKNLALVAVLFAFAFNLSDAHARRNPWIPNPGQQPPKQSEPIPTCLDRDRRPINGNNNDEVVRWKTTAKNQYLDRALVTGTFVRILNNKTDHLHFDMELDARGDGRSETANHLEVVYNREFGDIPNIRSGAAVIACGDFINSFAQAGRYPPSPVGAIIHWVHQSNNLGKHAHGFVMIDGVVYGDEGDALTGDSRNKGGNPAGKGYYDKQKRRWQNQDGQDDDAQSLFRGFWSMN